MSVTLSETLFELGAGVGAMFQLSDFHVLHTATTASPAFGLGGAALLLQPVQRGAHRKGRRAWGRWVTAWTDRRAVGQQGLNVSTDFGD